MAAGDFSVVASGPNWPIHGHFGGYRRSRSGSGAIAKAGWVWLATVCTIVVGNGSNALLEAGSDRMSQTGEVGCDRKREPRSLALLGMTNSGVPAKTAEFGVVLEVRFRVCCTAGHGGREKSEKRHHAVGYYRRPFGAGLLLVQASLGEPGLRFGRTLNSCGRN